jgi:hypothetical protein
MTPFKGRVQETARVVVYRNLTRGGWSLANLSGEDDRGLVFGHEPTAVVLRDVSFVVRSLRHEAIYRAHLRGEKKREVCAWCVGTLCNIAALHGETRALEYSPRDSRAYFRTAAGVPVRRAQFVILGNDGRAYAIGWRS